VCVRARVFLSVTFFSVRQELKFYVLFKQHGTLRS